MSKVALNDVEPQTLKLWKVTIDSELSLESEDFLKRVTATNELGPMKTVSTDLNDPMDHNNVIIVQRPRRLVPSA